MRVAICFSGQPRFVEEAHQSIIKNIIECNSNHEIDVFAHLWFSEDICNKPLYINEFSSFSGGATIPDDAIQKFVDYYKPLDIQVENSMTFTADESVKSKYQLWYINDKTDMGMSKEEWIDSKMVSEYSKYYSLCKSIGLKSKHETACGKKYDLVIRMRTDTKFFNNILLDSIDTSYFYSEYMNKPWYEISDWINFSRSEVMDKLGEIYNEFDNLVSHSHSNYGGWSAESLIKSMCEINNIPERTVYTGCILPGWGKYAR